MIGWEYPPHNSGGLGVACEGLSKAVANRNSPVYFTLPHSFAGSASHMQMLDCSDPSWVQGGEEPATTPPFFAYSGVSSVSPAVHKVYAAADLQELSSLPQTEMEKKVAEYAHAVTEKSRQVQDKYEVIHAHDWMSFPAGAELAQKTGKPLIAHIHSTEYDRIPSGLGSRYIMQTEYEGLQRADKVVAVSFYTKQLLTRQYNVDPNKITVIHNGIEPSAPATEAHSMNSFLSGRPVVVFMGRLTAQKGAHFFIELAGKILQKVPDALFVIAGSGDMYHELLLHTAGNKLTASVLFSGFIRDSQREKLLNRADVFVMPSLSEPFGLVALEAAQRHTPVVMSNTVGASEVLPGAISLDFWDTDKMMRVIVELLNNKRYAAAVVDTQLRDVSRATWDTAAERLIEMYRTLFIGSR